MARLYWKSLVVGIGAAVEPGSTTFWTSDFSSGPTMLHFVHDLLSAGFIVPQYMQTYRNHFARFLQVGDDARLLVLTVWSRTTYRLRVFFYCSLACSRIDRRRGDILETATSRFRRLLSTGSVPAVPAGVGIWHHLCCRAPVAARIAPTYDDRSSVSASEASSRSAATPSMTASASSRASLAGSVWS